MDKSKIIKLCIISLFAILAIIYYFSNTQTSYYENYLATNTISENIVTNETAKISTIKVYITGEVNNPGVIELEKGDRIDDAIKKSGGLTQNSNLKDINLAYELDDGDKIYIPNLSEEIMETTYSESQVPTSSNNQQNEKININKASVSDLTSIPGIGESTASKIITYREQNGKFESIEDIKKVSGIGSSKYEKIKDYISIK